MGVKKKNSSKQQLPPHAMDLQGLRHFFRATDGHSWVNRDNWLSSEPLETWKGVKVGDDGRVTELHLPQNGLTSESGIPDSIGLLTKLRLIDFDGNALGLGAPLPAALGNLLDLHSISLEDSGVEVPEGCSARCSTALEVSALFKAVGGGLCAKDRPFLVQLFEAWGGARSGWFRSEGWLSSLPLSEWFGVTVDNASGRVCKLYLGHNGLEGAFCDGGTGLAGLTQLSKLSLFGNELRGSAPSALATLVKLNYLDLEECALSLGAPFGGCPLECKNQAGVASLLKAAGLEELYRTEIAKEKKKAADRKARKERTEAAAAQASALAELGAMLPPPEDHDDELTAMGPGSRTSNKKEGNGKKKKGVVRSSVASQKKEQDALAVACVRERLALLSFASSTGRFTAWHHAAGWGVASTSTSETSTSTSSQGAVVGVSGEWFGVTMDPRGAAIAAGSVSKGGTGGQSQRVLKLELPSNGLEGSLDLAMRATVSAKAAAAMSAASANNQETVNELPGAALGGGGGGGGGGRRESRAAAAAGSLSALQQKLSPASSSLDLSGVSCGLFQCCTRLVVLDLRCNNLKGTLPDSVAQLAVLQELYLSLNSLEGPLPEGLGMLGCLEKLALNGNKFSGPLPGTALARLAGQCLGCLDLSCNPLLEVDLTRLPKGASLECNNKGKLVALLQALGVLKAQPPRKK